MSIELKFTRQMSSSISSSQTHLVESQRHVRLPSRRLRQQKTIDLTANGRDLTSVIGLMMSCLSMVAVCLTFPLSVFFCLVVVQEHERAVVFRNGRLEGLRGPGVVFVLPCVDSYLVVDLRTACYDVPPQQVLTKDSITVDVDAVILYHVHCPVSAVTEVDDFDKATRLLAASVLRNELGTKNLADIITGSSSISNNMKCILDSSSACWGVTIERVDILNVRLPVQMYRAMASEAQANREARAKMVEATGEMKASRALAEAGEILDQAPGAMHIRFLQAIGSVMTKDNQTVVVPVPLDLIEAVVQ